jgi:hypothetical protein
MNDIAQSTQLSSEWLQYYFNSYMLEMIVLDLVIGLVILMAHRWFVLTERKLNADTPPQTCATAQVIETSRLARPVSMPAKRPQPVVLA